MYRDILEPVLKKAQADNPVLPYVTYIIEELPEGWYHGKETNRLCTSKNNRTAQNVGSVRWMDLSTERGKLQVCWCGAQQHRICVGPAEATRTPQSFCRKRTKTQYSDSEEKERAMGGLTHYKATELCRSDTSSRALFYAVFGQEVNLKSGF